MQSISSVPAPLNAKPRKRDRVRFHQRAGVMTIEERDTLFLANIKLARGIAGNIIKRYGLQWDELDDLTQAGLAYALEHVPKYWLRSHGQPFKQIFRFSVRAGIGKYVRLRWTAVRGGRATHISLDRAPEGGISLSRTLAARGHRPDKLAAIHEQYEMWLPEITRMRAINDARNAAHARKRAAAIAGPSAGPMNAAA